MYFGDVCPLDTVLIGHESAIPAFASANSLVEECESFSIVAPQERRVFFNWIRHNVPAQLRVTRRTLSPFHRYPPIPIIDGKRNRMRIKFVIIGLILACECLPAADTLLSPDLGWLISWNPQSGAVTAWHSRILNAQPDGLAWDPANRTLFASSYPARLVELPSTPYNLYKINADTLAVTLAAPITGTASGTVTSLAYDALGKILYGVDTSYGYNPQTFASIVNSTTLYRIDTTTGVASVVTTFPAPGVRSITWDPDSGTLYGLTSDSSAPAIVRVDIANSALVQLMPLTSSFQTLAVVPGTLSFYSQELTPPAQPHFALVDARSGNVQQLGNIGANFVGPILYQDFGIAPESVPSYGPLSYTIDDLCYPAACRATLLNDEGLVAGVSTAPQNPLFTVGPGSQTTTLAGTEGLIPTSMNNRGDIVGTVPSSLVYPTGFLYAGGTGQLYNLPGNALHINNLGDITSGSGNFLGIDFEYLNGVNDSGVAFGQIYPHTGVVAMPGSTPVEIMWTAPSYFNNRGQSLMFLQGYYNTSELGLIGGFGVYSPGTGIRIVEAGIYELFASGFNDSGLALMAEQVPDSELLDTEQSVPGLGTSLVPLHYIVPLSSGWSRLRPVALNNKGQIAVQAVNLSDGRDTTILLTPNIPSTPVTSTPVAAHEQRAPAGCGPWTLNGARFDCVRPAPRLTR